MISMSKERCMQAPFAMKEKHVYDKNRKCIYCGEFNHETVKPGDKKVKAEDSRPKCPGKPPLGSMDIQGIMGAFEMNGRILAIQAHIDGMKIRNTICEINGRHPQYVEREFKQLADNIYQCAQRLQIMRNVQAVR